MRLAIVTTETTHHLYFVRECVKQFPECAVILETDLIKAPFQTEHEFELEREVVERELFQLGSEKQISDVVGEVRAFPHINTTEAFSFLRTLQPDLIVNFGGRNVQPELVEQFRGKFLNLHGGDPRKYRGLDTLLWAIYHGDFGALVTTLHFLSEKLDRGEIIGQRKISIKPGMRLSELRAVNTENCVELVLEASKLIGNIALPARGSKQQEIGRYYSFMPTCLKQICVEKFKRHTDRLSRKLAPSVPRGPREVR